jgi:hypothetical protein
MPISAPATPGTTNEYGWVLALDGFDDCQFTLVATTVAHQLHAQWESVGVLPPGRAGFAPDFPL